MQIHPGVLVDYNKAKMNLEKVFADKRFSNIQFRPHFKTHRSAETGILFRNFGIKKITVSSLKMAEYFADNGWDDILIAIPLNPNQIEHYNNLANRIKLHLLADNIDSLFYALSHLKKPIGFYLKADAGYGRAGWPAEDTRDFIRAVEMINSFGQHSFAGILSHFGNTYSAKSDSEIKSINLSSITRHSVLKGFIESHFGIQCPVSIGDTPSLPHYTPEILKNVTELRPGNFVYYDMMQVSLGTCDINNIAIALKSDILSFYPQRNEVLVNAGSIHLSKESCLMPDGKLGYGAIANINKKSIGSVIENCFVDRISQEHGILRVCPVFFNEFHIGDSIGILPVHSCLITSSSI
jgi:D-serine deaminase-like pyridoxal phosphate-dependent protein